MNPIVKLKSQQVVEYLKDHANKNTKLQTVFAIREFLQELGSYENSIDGLLGEIYAEEKMHMIKAQPNQKAIDGTINGKTVQVKTKGGKKKYKDSEHYISLSVKNELLVDLLLMVIIKDKEIHSHGPCERNKLIGREHNEGKSKRYYLSDINQALKSPN